jgi:hypothetical protein
MRPSLPASAPRQGEAVGRAERRPHSSRAGARLARRDRFGGTEGNEILTAATAVVLTGLLAAEGITIVNMHGLLSAHMFIGLVLIPPLLLKLASTGYRMVCYYAGSRAYRKKGPPLLPLRLMAPVLVAATLAVFVTGVLLLAAGHKSSTVLELHKLSFIVWGVVFGIHFLAYAPRTLHSLRTDSRAARRLRVPGSGLRGMMIAAVVGGGAALALALLPVIHAYHGGGFGH